MDRSSAHPALDEVNVLTAGLLATVRKLNEIATEEGSPIQASRKLVEIRDAVSDIASLQRTIGAYDEATKGVPHIAFIGQFNAGKSSLINALTRDNLRAVGENATDKVVTVISHPRNAEKSADTFTFRSLGVQPQSAESTFLDGLNLVDTPGTGDEELLHTLVREFLPICDWIVLVTPNTHAFDLTESQLLTVLAEKLREIPLALVVTRASNLLDQEDRSKFKPSVVADRRASLTKVYTEKFPGIPFRDTYFFFVSNHEQSDHAAPVDWRAVADAPGIHEVREALRTLPIDLRNAHGAKIKLFSRWCRERAASMWLFLSDLDQDLRDLIARVEDTRKRFEESYSDGNERFQRTWNQASLTISELKTEVATARQKTAVATAREDVRVATLANTAVEFSPSEKDEVRSITNEVVNDVRSEARQRLERYRSDLIAWAKSADIKWTDEFPLAPATVPKPVPVAETTRIAKERAASLLHRKGEDDGKAVTSAMADSQQRLKRFVDDAIPPSETDRLLKAEQRRATEFRQALHDELPKILQQIGDYQNLVFVKDVYDLISRTGFSGALGTVLDDRKPDPDGMALKIEASIFSTAVRSDARDPSRTRMRQATKDFEDYATIDQQVRDRLDQIDSDIEKLMSEMQKHVKRSTPARAVGAIERWAIEVREQDAHQVQAIKDKFLGVLKGIHVEAQRDLEAARDQNAARRRSGVWKGVVFGISVATLLSAVAYFQIVKPFDSEWNTHALSFVIGIVSTVFYEVGRSVLSPPEKVEARSKAEILKLARENAESRLNKMQIEFQAFEDKARDDARQRFEQSLLDDVRRLAQEFRDMHAELSQRLAAIAANLDRSRGNLFDSFDAFLDEMARWYTGNEQNRDAIKQLLDGQKNETIDKALKLFRDRQVAVATYMSKIESLFTADEFKSTVDAERRARTSGQNLLDGRRP